LSVQLPAEYRYSPREYRGDDPGGQEFGQAGKPVFSFESSWGFYEFGGIEDGDLVLVRQQSTANNGDLVVSLIDDDATVKEFHRTGDAVLLKPKSRNKKHQPIILTEDFQVQGVVVKTIKNF